MADLGAVGRPTEIGPWQFAFNATRVSEMVATSADQLVPCAGGLESAGIRVAKPIVADPWWRTGLAMTQQLSAVKQVDGVNTARRALFLLNGVAARMLSAETANILLKEFPLATGNYELMVHGHGSKRSEVWGPSSIARSYPLRLYGTLAACSSGVAYSSGLSVEGGNPTIVWDISGQALPTGLSFSTSTGVISGTTVVTGTTLHTIGVVDGDGYRRWKDVTLTVS